VVLVLKAMWLIVQMGIGLECPGIFKAYQAAMRKLIKDIREGRIKKTPSLKKWVEIGNSGVFRPEIPAKTGSLKHCH